MKPFSSASIMVIDQGTHSTRALLFDHNRALLATGMAPVASTLPRPGFVEQEPEAILQSARDAIAALAGNLNPGDSAGIAAVALIVQRSSLLACDRDSLAALTSVLGWQDTRNQPCIDGLRPQHANIQALTGLRPNAHYGASKMRWLLDNDPAVQQAARQGRLLFAPLAAWLAARLTGSRNCVVDPVIASRTLLMELETASWHPQLLQWFGLTADLLPAIVPSDHGFGSIMVGSRPIPLALVGGDQSFIPFAGGVPIDPDTAYVNVGTGAFVQMALSEAGGDERLLCSPLVVTAQARVVVMEGTVNAAATALDWLWQQAGTSLSHAAVAQALADETQPPVFINTLAGTGSPWWLPATTPVFTVDASLEARAVAVLESIVFALQDNIACLAQANPHLRRIVVGGGLSQLDGFCRKLAGLSGLEVLRPDMHEVSALGAACYVMQAAAVDQAGEVYRPEEDSGLCRRYGIYREAVTRLAAARGAL